MDDNRPRWLRELRPLPQPRSFNGPVVAPGEADAYAQAAFKAEVLAVQSAVESTRNDTLNTAAFNLAQLIASGHLPEQDVWHGLHDAGLRAGLTETETVKTIRSGFRAGMNEPRDVPERPPGAPRGSQSDPGDSSGGSGQDQEGTEGEGDAEPTYPDALDWPALWESEDEDEEWIVAPILPARRLVALYSPAKTGKSLLMLEVAVGVARGSTVLGYTPERPRRVLYVDLENDPRGDVRTRLQQMGFKPDDLTNLVYLSFPDLPMLDTMMGALRLMEVIEHYGCEVVVIDTISRLVAGEENDNNTWLAFYRNTGRLLKANGLTCVRLDHTGKDLSRGMRGGSAKYSDVDLVWSLTRPSDDTLQLECTAQRLPVKERFVTLTRRVDPWLHHVVAEEARLVAVKASEDDLISFLDFLRGTDTPIGVNEAMRLLREHGRGRRKPEVSALIKVRDGLLNTRGLAFGEGP